MFEVLVLKTQIPFPSLADLFYLLHGVFWMAGTFIILRKEEENILPSLSQIAPYIILLSINSYVLIFKDVKLADILNSTKSAEFLKFGLNIAYTLIDILNLGLLLIIILGPVFKKVARPMQFSFVLILLGLSFNYINDLFIDVLLPIESDKPSSYYQGNWIDFLYVIQFLC
jgi:hypothetical protein